MGGRAKKAWRSFKRNTKKVTNPLWQLKQGANVVGEVTDAFGITKNAGFGGPGAVGQIDPSAILGMGGTAGGAGGGAPAPFSAGSYGSPYTGMGADPILRQAAQSAVMSQPQTYGGASVTGIQQAGPTPGMQMANPNVGGNLLTKQLPNTLEQNILGLTGTAAGYRGQAGDVANRQVGGDVRNQQQALIEMLQQRASGEALSPAEMQLQRALQQQQAQAMGSAGSMYGLAPGRALQQGLAAQAQMGQQASWDQAIMRQMEAARAEEALGGALTGMRGQDMQMQQMNDSLVAMYESMGYDAQKAQIAAQQHMRDRFQQGSQFAAGMGLDQQKLAAQMEMFNADAKRAAEMAPTGLGQLTSAALGTIGSIYGGGAGAAARAAAGAAGGGGSHYTPPTLNVNTQLTPPPSSSDQL